ncbi:guanylate kinase [Algihabitans albus]|uniref:guanylate kinase n=1 Tax=Algihabitans albus TaxID=2164067 RepID=UPI000E5D8E1C|nr:guanylate kinase [Algihabitans albus]
MQVEDTNKQNDEGEAVARRGLVLVISSPSGAGKTTIARGLLASEPDLSLSVSCTTRPKRAGEVEGRDYRFVERDRFAEMAEADAFLEHALVHDHRYATPREPVERMLAAGQDVLLDIDWQGARQVRQAIDRDMVSVFVLPPSLAELERRLFARAADAEAVIRRRLKNALEEIEHWEDYDYVVVNRVAEAALADVRSILHAERLRRRRQAGLSAFVEGLLG